MDATFDLGAVSCHGKTVVIVVVVVITVGDFNKG
jgi:hypothetical protein